jgi:hypothetical protein
MESASEMVVKASILNIRIAEVVSNAGAPPLAASP